MNAGRLNRYVTIEEPTKTAVYGERTLTWSTLAQVWAEILPASSREAYRQSQVVAEMSYLVRIRYRDDVTADMRIAWGAKTLEIVGHPYEEYLDGSRLLTMPCREADNR
jgi:SPP1 family predicted phage head-tail adaptor